MRNFHELSQASKHEESWLTIVCVISPSQCRLASDTTIRELVEESGLGVHRGTVPERHRDRDRTTSGQEARRFAGVAPGISSDGDAVGFFACDQHTSSSRLGTVAVPRLT